MLGICRSLIPMLLSIERLRTAFNQGRLQDVKELFISGARQSIEMYGIEGRILQDNAVILDPRSPR